MATSIGAPPFLELRVALTAQDYDRLAEFYSESLGIAPITTWSNWQGRAAVFELGRATLELFDGQQAATVDAIEAGRRSSGQVRLALKVVDLASVVERLAAKGVTLEHPPVVTPWGQLNARVEAPDGMQITLFQDTSPKGESF